VWQSSAARVLLVLQGGAVWVLQGVLQRVFRSVYCSVCCSVCYRVCCSVTGTVCCDVLHCVLQGCAICCRVVPCVAVERGRDHHHDDLTLQQRAAVCCSMVPRVAVCCLQPLHHVPCAVAADTRPPAPRCLPPPAPTSTTAVCPFWAAMKRQLKPSFWTHIISGMPPSLHSTCTHAAPCVSFVTVCVCV